MQAATVPAADGAAGFVEHTFHWPRDAFQVKITGDWLGWSSGLTMKRNATGKGFHLSAPLPAGTTIAYKFIVQETSSSAAAWQYSSALPFREDQYGNINNFLDVPSVPSVHTGQVSSSVHGESTGASADLPARAGGPTSTSAPRGSAIGEPEYTSAAAAASSSSGSAFLSSSSRGGSGLDIRIPSASTGQGGYIGAGVAREYSEEYGLSVDVAAGGARPMPKSMSVGDMRSLENSMAGGRWPRGGASGTYGGGAHPAHGRHFRAYHSSTTYAASAVTPRARADTGNSSSDPQLTGGTHGVASMSRSNSGDTSNPATAAALAAAAAMAAARRGDTWLEAHRFRGEVHSEAEEDDEGGRDAPGLPLEESGAGAGAGGAGAGAGAGGIGFHADVSRGHGARTAAVKGAQSSMPLFPGAAATTAAVPLPMSLPVPMVLSGLEPPTGLVALATLAPTTAAVGGPGLAAATVAAALPAAAAAAPVASSSGGGTLPRTASASLQGAAATAVPGTPSATVTAASGAPGVTAAAAATAATPLLAVDVAVGIPVSIPIDRSAIVPAMTGALAPSLLANGGGGSGMPGHSHGHSGSATVMSNEQALLRREGKLVLAMVGLPARGKTFMARRLKRHLSWMSYRVEIFNVGNYRRKYLGANQPHDFFDPHNEEGERKRNEMARIAFEEMCELLNSDVIDIAIFDATNTTRERRRWLVGAMRAANPTFKLVFIESICNDENIIRSNVRETKLRSPDYRDMAEQVAVADFLQRIQHYQTVYQELGEKDEDDIPYIKLIDVGQKIIANHINGFLNSRIMFFLSNLHITPRPIWLTRHGESEYNVQGRIGGDSLLSPRGQAYALRLSAFMSKMYPSGSSELVVWTSTLRRTAMTAAPLGREIVQWKALDEIDAGVCDGMTYEAIAATMPDEYASRAKNKFTYRYPRGESYQDIVHRLEPVIIELMRQRTPVLIVSHQATLRVLYAYLTDKPPETCPDVLLPLHTVVQLTQKAYGAEEVRHELM